jgi:hypothetical protein
MLLTVSRGVRMPVKERDLPLLQTSGPTLGPTQPSTQRVPGFFSEGKAAVASSKPHLKLAPRLRHSGAIPRLSLYALRAWTRKILSSVSLLTSHRMSLSSCSHPWFLPMCSGIQILYLAQKPSDPDWYMLPLSSVIWRKYRNSQLSKIK